MDLKKQKNTPFITSKLLGPRHELKNINIIHSKALKKYWSSTINRSSSDSDSSLSSDRNQNERKQPNESKEMNKLYNLVTNRINNIDQCNDSIEYETNFDDQFNLSSRTKDPLPLVTVILRGGKKKRATIIEA